jgi:small subunit ribosomal protein S1
MTISINEHDSQDSHIMREIMAQVELPPQLADMVEGKVLSIGANAVYIDLTPFGTGIIYGREFINARSVIRNISIGDTVEAKVVDTENENGYIELSLKEARQALIWSEAEEAIRSSSVFELPVKEANKGGLILEWQGINGFLPASQLKAEHYPRVNDGDKDKILVELKELIGKKLYVSIITASPKEGKLIFSEKDQGKEEREDIVKRYEVGDTIRGTITGIVDFGVFIRVEDGLEGLAHISELDWGLVDDPREMFRAGEEVKAKIIEKTDNKISLSIKALKENPWSEAAKRYKIGDEVNGVIIKYNKHGALASIEEGIAGLVHISEFGSEDDLRNILELGKNYTFKISIFDPNERRMALVYRNEDSK